MQLVSSSSTTISSSFLSHDFLLFLVGPNYWATWLNSGLGAAVPRAGARASVDLQLLESAVQQLVLGQHALDSLLNRANGVGLKQL